jgi:hypothetical protein
MMQLYSKQEHLICISHVENPCKLEIQLFENTNNLNKLMVILNFIKKIRLNNNKN